MIANGVEVGFQRAGSLGRGFDARQLVEIMSRMRQIVADRHRLLAIPHPPIGSHDCREGRDRGHRVVQWVFLPAETESGGSHTKGVHGRYLRRRSLAKDSAGCTGERPPSGEVPREWNVLRWLGQTALQEQVSNFFETGVWRQLLDRIAGKDQLSRLTIDMA